MTRAAILAQLRSQGMRLSYTARVSWWRRLLGEDGDGDALCVMWVGHPTLFVGERATGREIAREVARFRSVLCG